MKALALTMHGNMVIHIYLRYAIMGPMVELKDHSVHENVFSFYFQNAYVFYFQNAYVFSSQNNMGELTMKGIIVKMILKLENFKILFLVLLEN